MARKCKNCMNEGRVIGTDEYCKCLYGRQKRSEDEQYVQQAKAEIEATKQMEKATKTMKKKKVLPSYAVGEGDWTKHGNIYGVVGEFKGDQFLFMASHTFGQVTGERVTVMKHAWVDAAKYLPASLETFDNEYEMMIQAAFAMEDHDLFNEYSNALYELKDHRKQALDLMVEWSLKFKDESMFQFATKELKKVK